MSLRERREGEWGAPLTRADEVGQQIADVLRLDAEQAHEALTRPPGDFDNREEQPVGELERECGGEDDLVGGLTEERLRDDLAEDEHDRRGDDRLEDEHEALDGCVRPEPAVQQRREGRVEV